MSASQIDLDWTASNDNIGVVYYEISRGTTIVGTSTGTEFSDTGLAPETEYTYTVRAFDAAGNASAASEPASTTTLAGGGGSAITFRAASSAGERSAASLSLAKPSGAQPGDVLVASLDVRGTPTVTAPAGWTLVRSDASSGTMTKATYWHLVGPSDPGPYAWGLLVRRGCNGDRSRVQRSGSDLTDRCTQRSDELYDGDRCADGRPARLDR